MSKRGNPEKENRSYRLEKLRFLSSIIPWFREKLQVINRKTLRLQEIQKKYLGNFELLKEYLYDEGLSTCLLNEVRSLSKDYLKLLKSFDEYLEGSFTENSFYLEVHPGVGGREANLFAEELLYKYKAVLIFKNLPFKEENRKLLLSSPAATFVSKENGVHRVQRIPATESTGRVHTSTVKVSLTSVFRNLEVNLNEAELKIEAMRSSGPGGQHVNTTSSAVRLTHIATGKMVKIDGARNQSENRIEAERVLKDKLRNLAAEVIEELAQKNRGGISLERSDKIRTYNFQTDRVTDHRCGLKTSMILWEDTEKMCEFISKVYLFLD